MRLNYAKNREERIAILSKINEYNAIESSENGKKLLVKLLILRKFSLPNPLLPAPMLLYPHQGSQGY